MANFHMRPQVISRANGRSAINAAAYRRGARLEDERTGEVFDYRAKDDIAYSEITVAADAPAWAKALTARDDPGASAALWNRVEKNEKRKDAQLAREFRLSLPVELTLDENIALMREFVSEELAARGFAVDWSIHYGKGRNIHAHIMLPMSPLTETGFAAKKVAVTDERTGEKKRDKRGRIVYRFGNEWGGEADYNALRAACADYQNLHLARAGLDVRVDHRSYAERGIGLTAMGDSRQKAFNMRQRGKQAARGAGFEEARAKGAREIEARPELVLEAITEKKAVFTRNDITREIRLRIDDPARVQRILDRLDASPELVELAPPRGRRAARYSARSFMRDENAMAGAAARLDRRKTHGLSKEQIEAALAKRPEFTQDQIDAFVHVTGAGGIKPVVGWAGTGKTYFMAAVREAFEAQGFRVIGAAPTGRAARGLQEDAGIPSETLTKLEMNWRAGRGRLQPRDVLVIDEAGMVGSRTLGRVLAEAERAGAKVILVGDPQQLQPIEAGAGFRAITERVAVAHLTTIRRQEEPWAREATKWLAKGKVRDALTAYRVRGFVHMHISREAAKDRIALDWLKERTPDTSGIIFAHTNEDVGGLNRAIRSARRAAGELREEAPFMTERGERQFAAGDRVLFLRNDRRQGVTNGTLGTVEQAGKGRLSVRLDNGEQRQVDQENYNDLDHGYAVTFGKGQGVSVDRAYVLATSGMDSHSTYVGMSRHKKMARLYAGRDDFHDERTMGVALEINRPKETTLDFAARRGVYSWRDFLENGRELLATMAGRFERGAARMWERLGLTPAERGEKGWLEAAVAQKVRNESEKHRRGGAGLALDAAASKELRRLERVTPYLAKRAGRRIERMTNELQEFDKTAPKKGLFEGEKTFANRKAAWDAGRKQRAEAIKNAQDERNEMLKRGQKPAGYGLYSTQSENEKIALKRVRERYPHTAKVADREDDLERVRVSARIGARVDRDIAQSKSQSKSKSLGH